MPPLCCTDRPEPGVIHAPVPVVTQYATADLIDAIAYGDHDPGNDPNWPATGAPSQSVYARWCRHLCGIACLEMALLHRDGHALNQFELLAGARRYGAYVRQRDGIKGLIYAPFVDYVRDTHGLDGEVHPNLDMTGLAEQLDAGRLVMASVSKEIRRPEHAPQRRGGHLVLLIGHNQGLIIFRNPSGHTPQARAAVMDMKEFEPFFGGRAISLNLRRTVEPRPAWTGGARSVASRPTT
ncbi:C39 family peptidase [Streptomyces sp. NPDC048275]|uniref:C39 family peptidase n=1 Tax=Streptomyces sp. NPDC048275 TaxID=3155629 RepID=UPI0033C82F4F